MMKKLVALLMALALLCTSIGAFATEVEPKAPATSWEVVLGEHYANKKDTTENCKEATCEEDGWIEYKCQDPECAQGTFKVTIPAHGHKVPEGLTMETGSVITKEATCVEPGIRTWSSCFYGDHEWTEVINPIDHLWAVKKDAEGNPVIVAPTCLEDGYTVYECVREGCDAEKHDDTVRTDGHEWALNPYYEGQDVPPYNPDAETTWNPFYIWSEVDSASCVDGGKLVKFTYCARCHYKDVISEESTYWDPLDHQAFLEEFIAQPADVEDEAYIEWLLEKVHNADRYTESFDGSDLIDGIIVCNGHQIETTKDPYKAFHHPVQITVDAPTCTEEGLLTLACTKCAAKVQVVIPATGHEYAYEVVPGSIPTCLEDGKIMVYCTNDNCEFKEQIDVKAPGKHHYSETPTSYSQVKYFETLNHETAFTRVAQCIDYTEHYACQGFEITVTLKNGYKFTFTVGGCSAEFDNVVPGNGEHDKAAENYAYRDSTCTEEGYEYFYCKACGYSYGQSIPMKEHKLVYKVIDKPTCTEDGMAHWDCSVCKQTIKEQVLPMTGHNYQVTEHKDKTCTVDGYDLHTCLYCGDNYKEIIPACHEAPLPQDIKPGENNNQAYKAPTCTETGLQSYECTVCHTPVINEVIPALGHVYDMYEDKAADTIIVDGEIWNTYTPATCMNEAYYTRTCLRCGKKETKTVGEKLGHLMAKWNANESGTMCVNSLVLDTSNLPTCTSTGKAYYNCVVCGELVEDFVLPELSHNEQVVWNPEKRVYEVTCVKATWDKWIDLMDGYLWDEISACTEDTVLATVVYEDVIAELKEKLMAKDKINIPGIGCGATKEIKVNKTHYDIALGDNIVTLTPDENCALLSKPMVIVNWAYTLGDGTAFSYTRLFREEEAGSLTYDLGLAETPVGSYLESITVIVTDTVTLDITEAAKGYGYEQF